MNLNELYTTDSCLAHDFIDGQENKEIEITDGSVRHAIDYAYFVRCLESQMFKENARTVYTRGDCGNYACMLERSLLKHKYERGKILYLARPCHIVTELNDNDLKKSFWLDINGIRPQGKSYEPRIARIDLHECCDNYERNINVAFKLKNIFKSDEKIIFEANNRVRKCIIAMSDKLFPAWQKKMRETDCKDTQIEHTYETKQIKDELLKGIDIRGQRGLRRNIMRGL